MGHSPESSFCDENLEVWNSHGIFILNSAVFPTGSDSNPTFMSLVLSHRLVEYIAKKLGIKSNF